MPQSIQPPAQCEVYEVQIEEETKDELHSDSTPKNDVKHVQQVSSCQSNSENTKSSKNFSTKQHAQEEEKLPAELVQHSSSKMSLSRDVIEQLYDEELGCNLVKMPQIIDISKYKRAGKHEDKQGQPKKQPRLRTKQLNAPRIANEARIALNSDLQSGTATLRAAA